MISSVCLPCVLLKSRPHPHLQTFLAASSAKIISGVSSVA
jgi:hypothetical protein